MYIADYKKHNVLVIEAGQSTPQVYFHSDRFNQPNDLAVASDGTLFASDPRFRTPARSGASCGVATERGTASERSMGLPTALI
jgi:hypothetical protein